MGLQGWLGYAYDVFYDLPPVAVAAIGLILTPVTMFIIGILAEKRILPIGKGQSRAFIPGDFCLGPIMGLAVAQIPLLPKSGFWQSWFWPVAVVVVAIVAIVFQRLVGDAPNYKVSEGATANSPTKWYHDIVLYGILGSTMAVVAIPVLVSTANTWLKFAMVALLFVWLIGLIYDSIRPEHMRRRVMHPSNWHERTWQDLLNDPFDKKSRY